MCKFSYILWYWWTVYYAWLSRIFSSSFLDDNRLISSFLVSIKSLNLRIYFSCSSRTRMMVEFSVFLIVAYFFYFKEGIFTSIFDSFWWTYECFSLISKHYDSSIDDVLIVKFSWTFNFWWFLSFSLINIYLSTLFSSEEDSLAMM